METGQTDPLVNSYTHSPLPAVLQLKGSPVALGSPPSWGLEEMTEPVRNEPELPVLSPQVRGNIKTKIIIQNFTDSFAWDTNIQKICVQESP